MRVHSEARSLQTLIGGLMSQGSGSGKTALSFSASKGFHMSRSQDGPVFLPPQSYLAKRSHPWPCREITQPFTDMDGFVYRAVLETTASEIKDAWELLRVPERLMPTLQDPGMKFPLQ